MTISSISNNPYLQQIAGTSSTSSVSGTTPPPPPMGYFRTLAILPEKTYRIPVLPVKVVSTAGAGDGVLAGLAAALDAGWPLEEGLRLGTAMAGAVCMQLATADCRKADIENLLPQVRLLSYS